MGTSGGADLKDLDTNALVAAARLGAVELAKGLLEHGVNLNKQCPPNRGMGLHAAAEAGRTELVEALLAHGADVDAMGTTRERYDMLRPIELAAGHGHAAVVKLLCEHGADVEPRPGVGADGPLTRAAMWGHLEVIECLLAYGAEVDFGRQNTSLYHAAGRHAAVVKLLLERGADPARVDYPGKLLSAAVEGGSLEVVEELITHGMNVQREHSGGASPIRRAAWAGNKAIVALLLENGAVTMAKERDRLAGAADVRGQHRLDFSVHAAAESRS